MCSRYLALSHKSFPLEQSSTTSAIEQPSNEARTHAIEKMMKCVKLQHMETKYKSIWNLSNDRQDIMMLQYLPNENCKLQQSMLLIVAKR